MRNVRFSREISRGISQVFSGEFANTSLFATYYERLVLSDGYYNPVALEIELAKQAYATNKENYDKAGQGVPETPENGVPAKTKQPERYARPPPVLCGRSFAIVRGHGGLGRAARRESVRVRVCSSV